MIQICRLPAGGRIDGSTYSGSCACLVGTIAKIRGVEVSDLSHNLKRPAERWFAMIKAGDMPGDHSGGGFASKMALQWCLEWCAAIGTTGPDHSPAQIAT